MVTMKKSVVKLKLSIKVWKVPNIAAENNVRVIQIGNILNYR